MDNKSIITENENKLTTEFYKQNTNSRQFRVKLKELEQSNLSTNNFILKSLYLLAYSQFEIYMRDIYEFARKANESLPNLKIKERVPDTIFSHLEIDIDAEFHKSEKLTFDYLRLRRNRIVHRESKTQGDLADLIRQKGNSLQKYWTETLKNGLFGLNFQSSSISEFPKEEIFDFINIYRFLIKKTDLIISERIGKDGIVNNLKSEFIKQNSTQIKSWGIKKANKKFINYCKVNYNFKIKLEEFENINGVVA